MIKTIDDFKKYIPSIDFKEFEIIETYVDTATKKIKKDLLGQPLYDYINTDLEANEDLVSIVKNLICHAAYYECIPFLNLTHKATGIAVIQTKDLTPASKARIEALSNATAAKRDELIEDVFDFLEANVRYHEKWQLSPAYSILNDCIIRTADELKKYVSWNGTRSDFLKLKPIIKIKLELEIYPYFSKELVHDLKDKQEKCDLFDEDLEAMEYIKTCLANYVLEQDYITSNLRNQAIEYIEINIAQFPSYANSNVYKNKQNIKRYNNNSSSIFSL